MVRLMRWVLVPALLGWLVGATPVVAQNRTSFIQDEAGFFSKEAIAKANAEISRMQQQFKRELIVDTVVSVAVPADKKEQEDRFFDNWAENRFLHEKIKGVYVVIVRDPHKLRVRLGTETERSGAFTKADVQELDNQLIANLKAANKERLKNQAKNDQILLAATAFVHERFSQHARQVAEQKQAAPAPRSTPPPVQPGQAGGGVPWLTYLLIGIGIFLVLWLIMGIVRALSGGGGGARNPGMGMGGGGYGGGGGGGGGFFSSLLGGMFGAAAGMWMYNNFFGGHTSSAWGAGPSDTQGGGGNGPSAGGDADTGSTGGGGDWGDTGGDQGGSDAGGGDWGGGGGGDWGGGGGGDFGGGGGGGDW